MAISDMFRKGRLGYIGLDVSDSSIEAVQLQGQPGGKSYEIVGLSRVELPVGVVAKGRIVKPTEFKEKARQLLSKPTQGYLESKSIILSVAEHQCFHNTFPIRTGQESLTMFNRLQGSVIARTPFTLKEIDWDWELTVQKGSNDFIYSVAIPKAVTDEYRQVFKALGIQVMVIEPQVVSASRYLWRQVPIDEPHVYFDIGAEETAISTVDDMGIHQSSVVSVGFNQIQKDLARSLAVDSKVAREILLKIGLRQIKHSKVEQIHQSITGSVEKIIVDAKQHISFYSTLVHVSPQVIKNLLAAGGGSLIPRLPEYLTEQLHLQLDTITPWAGFKPELDHQSIVLYLNALGAAMRGVYTSEASKHGVNVLHTKRVAEKKGGWFRRKATKQKKKVKKKSGKVGKTDSERK